MPVVTSPLVQNALVPTVPTALGVEEIVELVELVLTWREDHDA